MSTKFNVTTTTTDEYFKILNQDKLNPSDLTKKESYEDFIENCQKYEDIITPATQSVLASYNSKLMNLSSKENKTSYEEEVVKNFKAPFQNQAEAERTNGPVRKLAKSGFIDATIIIVIILNIGFTIAMTILGR
jgi:hypothetical protein